MNRTPADFLHVLRPRHALLALMLGASILTTARAASLSLPAALAPASPALQEVGRGKLTWMRLGVYQAALYAGQGRFAPDRPAALVIHYQRDITRAQLIEATAKAWAETDPAPAARRQGWLERLGELWPDVRRDDVLAVQVIPGTATTFVYNGAVLGQVDDPAFGPAFLGVWLHPETPSPKLRRALLGQTS